MAYTNEELISELQRFYSENDRVPIASEMNYKNGYPSFGVYQRRFGSYNNGVKAAGYEPNQTHHIEILNGTEVCSYCGKRADEIPKFKSWLYPNGIRYCEKHGNSGGKGIPDYAKGNLDVNSEVGRGRSGEILVLKKLEIGTEFDCNRISCGYKVDLYNDEYGKIDVKTSLLSYDYNRWIFNFVKKKDAKTYICVGLTETGRHVSHVWIVPNVDKIRNQTGITIKNTPYSLFNREHCEVYSTPYNDVWQEMIINYQNGNCKIFN